MGYRLKTTKSNQKDFFRSVKAVSKKDWKNLAQLCQVSDRTIREWAKASYLAPFSKYLLLSKKFFIPLPKDYKLRVK